MYNNVAATSSKMASLRLIYLFFAVSMKFALKIVLNYYLNSIQKSIFSVRSIYVVFFAEDLFMQH